MHFGFFVRKMSHRKKLLEVESDNLDENFYFEQVNDQVYDTSDEKNSEDEEETASRKIEALRRLVDLEQPTPFENDNQQRIDEYAREQKVQPEDQPATVVGEPATDLDQQPQPPVAAAVDYKAMAKCLMDG